MAKTAISSRGNAVNFSATAIVSTLFAILLINRMAAELSLVPAENFTAAAAKKLKANR